MVLYDHKSPLITLVKYTSIITAAMEQLYALNDHKSPLITPVKQITVLLFLSLGFYLNPSCTVKILNLIYQNLLCTQNCIANQASILNRPQLSVCALLGEACCILRHGQCRYCGGFLSKLQSSNIFFFAQGILPYIVSSHSTLTYFCPCSGIF